MTYEIQFEALGDGTRRAILERLLLQGPMPVGKLAEGLPVNPSRQFRSICGS